MTAAPPPHVVEVARVRAAASPCGKSKRGAVIFDPESGNVFAHGHNHLPAGECAATAFARYYPSGIVTSPPAIRLREAAAACRSSCGTRCVHAEAEAIIRAASPLRYRGQFEIVHVKVVEGAVVASGPPSCVPCAALILAAGIGAAWLLHQVGPSCPGERCPYCAGEACALCDGRPRPWDPPCEHDGLERHEGAPPPAMEWRRYMAAEFYRLSCKAKGLPEPTT